MLLGYFLRCISCVVVQQASGERGISMDATVLSSNVIADPDYVTLNRLASMGVYGRVAYVRPHQPSHRDRIQVVGRAGTANRAGSLHEARAWPPTRTWFEFRDSTLPTGPGSGASRCLCVCVCVQAKNCC